MSPHRFAGARDKDENNDQCFELIEGQVLVIVKYVRWIERQVQMCSNNLYLSRPSLTSAVTNASHDVDRQKALKP